NVHGRWDSPANDARCIAWARDLFKACGPLSTGAVYVNFLTQDEEDRVKMAYGANYDRLAAVKKKLDPTNLFRLNQNIRPASESGLLVSACAPPRWRARDSGAHARRCRLDRAGADRPGASPLRRTGRRRA